MINFSYSYDSEDSMDDDESKNRFPYRKPVEDKYRKGESRDFSGEPFDDTDYDYWNRYYD